MRAAVFRGVGQPLSLEQVPDPEPRPGEAILEVSHAGICGSDLHWTETPGMITNLVSLDEFPAAFEALRTPSSQCKVLVRM
jgi:(R,R)-butanediol dehydrogenase / meso-butanediol dehydrogenase / diacetyl reductase